MSLPPQPASSTSSQLGPPAPKTTYDPAPLFSENQTLREQLLHLHNALATTYTPGHEALRVRCENAEATVKIATADVHTATACGATARAETLVISARLEDETAAKNNAQRLLNEKTKEVERLKKEVKSLEQRERTSQKKIGNFENTAKQTRARMAEMQQKGAEMKEKMRELEAEMKKSAAEGKKLEGKAEKMERVADAARAACKTMEDRLKGERATAKEREKKLQNRVEAELVHVKRMEDERNEWKRKAEMTARRLRMEEERSTRLEEVHRNFTLPPAPSLLDGNNDVLLSPAPLADLKNVETESPYSESRSKFTSLPFPTEGESTEDARPSRQGKKRSKPESGSQSVSTRKRKSAYVPSSLAGEVRTRKSPRFGNKTPNAGDKQVTGTREEKSRAKSGEQSGEQSGTPRAVEPLSPIKRRKVESGRSKKDVAIVENATSRQTRQAAISRGESAEGNAMRRVLRSQRRVSYDYNQAGRDITNTAPGVEVNNRAMGRKRVRQTKKPSKWRKA